MSFLETVSKWFERSTGYPDLSATYKLHKLNMQINTFDIDGVISIKPGIGVYPGPRDHIITGRSVEEKLETDQMLLRKGIKNQVHFNKLSFNKKTRESSGEHKAKTIKLLQAGGYEIGAHFEDDEVQVAIIRRECPDISVIHIVHNLTEKENVRHIDD